MITNIIKDLLSAIDTLWQWSQNHIEIILALIALFSGGGYAVKGKKHKHFIDFAKKIFIKKSIKKS